ncbi:MAG: HEAT repeat domain-containing protein [Planctomycetales bacterium]|nr:HEAT repeat domain-containing protein [Planctomycetales bacterium]
MLPNLRFDIRDLKCISRAMLAVALLALTVVPASADLITLKSGGELRGQIQAAKDSKATTPYVIKTLAGSVVEVARDEVESVTRRRVVIEEYEVRVRETADTVEAQWELAEWCRERSMTPQRRTHLERIVELDPRHDRAHRGLGHVYEQGRWTTQDEIMSARGYVKHKGRWVLPQELALMEEEKRETEAEKAWFKRIKMWQGWLTDIGKPDRQQEAYRSLVAIDDPHAVPALIKTFYGAANEDQRLMYVGILKQIDSEKAAGALTLQSLHDESDSVRTAAIAGIRAAYREKAIRAYVGALKHGVNQIVLRAGEALGTIGDEAIVPALIDALVTTHRYKVTVPGGAGTTVSMSSDGNLVPNGISLPPEIAGMLLTGQLPFGVQVGPQPGAVSQQVTVKRDEQNVTVLTALQNLTGENLGYDELLWKRWWTEKSAGGANAKSKTKR